MKTKITFMVFVLLIVTSITGQISCIENNSLKIDTTTNCSIRYIYFPNMHAYYDKLDEVYIFKLKGEWTYSKELPTLYGGYSLYSNVGVEITDFDDDIPQSNYIQHKKQFPYNAKGRFTFETAAAF